MILYLLKRDFLDGDSRYFCPYCLRIEGLMAMFPEIRHSIEVRYVDFAKPRGELPDFLGEANQSCPNLVLTDGDRYGSEKYSVMAPTGTRHIDSTDNIIAYFIERFGLPQMH
ncbi:DUF3088 family protein [Shewanella corallii]|uniref:DUF3088 family protein n=1 Tax=Shewanella corallii TaxID=560080 RepID=UPI003D166D04